jgi:hypothetical protein
MTGMKTTNLVIAALSGMVFRADTSAQPDWRKPARPAGPCR